MRYLILATLGTALFWGAYWILMRRETRFTMVRYYLLGTLFLALLLPLVHLPLQMPMSFHSSEETTIQQRYAATDDGMSSSVIGQGGTNSMTVQQDNSRLSTLGLRQENPNLVSSRSDTLSLVLMVVYLIGCAGAAIVFILRIISLMRRLHSIPYVVEDGIRVSRLEDETQAFSFGNHIVVGCRGFSATEVQQLIGHEKVHVRQHHTLDLLLCEVSKVLLWFNPMVYLYQRELKRIHEYIADKEMLSGEEAADYAELLYHQMSGKPYCPITNTFDYSIVGRRIAMMSRQRTHRGWLKPLVAVPVAALLLVAGCSQEGTLDGMYTVSGIALMSDNPAEPTLQCSEFFDLESRIFNFHPDGRVDIIFQQEDSATIHGKYEVDGEGLHIFDNSGKRWLDMQIETVHCDADSIVLRFIDPDPLSGLGKMLAGLPTYRYRIDTVTVSSQTKLGDQIIEQYEGTKCDTVFAHVTVPCQYSDSGDWNNGNRLLGAATTTVSTFVHQYETLSGETKEDFGTQWEFCNNAIVSDARQSYDTIGAFNPRMEGDRFILEVTLKADKRNKSI